MEQNIQCVSYLRVSTQKQGIGGLGIEAQRAAVANFLNQGNKSLLKEFAEVESGKRKDRPELERAIALCRKTKSTLVIAKLDRLARSSTTIFSPE
jgi:DNA invertase Pin-like site-specific DNA recombinase